LEISIAIFLVQPSAQFYLELGEKGKLFQEITQDNDKSSFLQIDTKKQDKLCVEKLDRIFMTTTYDFSIISKIYGRSSNQSITIETSLLHKQVIVENEVDGM
jgi:hypothetical protein